jgi:hypothetical protein
LGILPSSFRKFIFATKIRSDVINSKEIDRAKFIKDAENKKSETQNKFKRSLKFN